MHLVKESQVANRQDLIEAAERLADFIQDYLDRGENVPIINIIGSVSAGKSLFWDFVTQKLLGSSAIFIDSKSESSQFDRIYETWTKLDEGKNKGLKLFFCNARSTLSGHRNLNLDIEDIDAEKLRTLGDVIILTNGWKDLIPEGVPQVEINLTVMNNKPEKIFPIHLAYACNF